MALTPFFGKKAAAAALAALTLGAGLTLGTTGAEARNGRNGGLIAAGVVGALVTGAIIAGASNAHAAPGYYADTGYDVGPATGYAVAQPVYYDERPVYEYNRPVHPGYYAGHRPRHPGYSETGYAYRGPVCKIRKERVFDGYGWRIQRTQVCR
jgi:hypothetical protein